MDVSIKHVLQVNEGKRKVVKWKGEAYASYAIRTCVVTEKHSLSGLIEEYVQPYIKPGDVVILSEKMLACTQGRAIPLEKLHPGFWARVLSRFVTRSPYGIGLSIPETMQCAIDECGLFRILLAAAVGGAARLFRKKGWFYRVAGSKAAAIDGPCPYTLPPYNRYVVLGPDRPDEAAQAVSEQMGGILTLVVDCNDLGCEILGCSHRKADRQKYICLLRQNPLGQGDECTPVGVLRPIRENKALE